MKHFSFLPCSILLLGLMSLLFARTSVNAASVNATSVNTASSAPGASRVKERHIEGAINVAEAQLEKGFNYVVRQKFPVRGDDLEGRHSVLRLFEDDKELGPAHALVETIQKVGRGAFNHWTDALYFSTSDNSDPRTNGRKYVYRISFTEAEIANSLETGLKNGQLQLRLHRVIEGLMRTPLTAQVSAGVIGAKSLIKRALPLQRGQWATVLPLKSLPPQGLHLTVEIPMNTGEPIKIVRDLFTPHVLSLEVNAKAWTATARGKWAVRPDSRALRGMWHPWQASETGSFAQVVRAVKVPATWRGPLILQFHSSDSYVGVGYQKDQGPHYVGANIFLKHRFKRVLVNQKVVWESDIADALEPTYFSVDISQHVKPGQTFQLALRVDDVVTSRKQLPGDDQMGWTWDPKEIPSRETANRSPEIDARFETRLFWGDVGLVNQWRGAGNTNSFAPTPAQLKIPHWRPPHALKAARRVTLPLEAPARLPAGGFPVTCGVPFNSGELTDSQQVRLLAFTGREVPLQTKVLGTWPDGSIKWLLFDFIARDANAHTLVFGPGVQRAAVQTSLQVIRSDTGVTIKNGALNWDFDKNAHTLTNHIAASLTESSRNFRFKNEAVEVLEAGPIRAAVKVSGHITREGTANLGRFTVRLETYAGMPFARCFLRIFNDAGRTLKISDFAVTVPTSGISSANFGSGSPQVAVPATLHQTGWKQFQLHAGDSVPVAGAPVAGAPATGVPTSGAPATGERAEGWVAGVGANGNMTVVAVRHFYQQFPKSLQVLSTGVTTHLFAPTPGEPFYEPTMGEAKGHEMLIGYLPDAASAQSVAQCFQNPPRLFAPVYFCESGGLGDASVHDEKHFPAFHEASKTLHGELDLETRGKGLRHFPDTYSGATTGAFIDSWINFYHDQFHGMCLEYLMTGDRRWFDLAQAASRHYMDVDIIHHWPANPNLIGLPHGTGSNHTGHDPYALIAHLNGLVDVYFLTGDPDAWEAALGVGAGIMRNGWGFGGSARDTGWPMQGLGRLYRETRDPKYLAYLKRLLNSALAHTMIRRGIYHESHGSLSYRGQVPFMTAILGRGLMFLVQDTRDPDAAFLLVQLARALAAESQQAPGQFEYSPNPHLRGATAPSNYNFLLAPIFLAGHGIGGDRVLLDTGIATAEWGIEQKAFNLQSYFNAGEMLYLLDKFAPDRFAVSVAFEHIMQRTPDGWKVLFNGSRSSSTQGKIASWQWIFDSATTSDATATDATASGATVARTYARSGPVKVLLTVTDTAGTRKSMQRTLQLPPGPQDFGLKQWNAIVRTEAESFVAQGGGAVVVRADKKGASEKSFSHWAPKNHWLEWKAEIPSDGNYYLLARYATPENSTRSVTLDGQPQPVFQFPASGGYGSSTQDNWSFATLKDKNGKPLSLRLTKGTHHLRLENQDGTGLNTDYFEWIAQ